MNDENHSVIDPRMQQNAPSGDVFATPVPGNSGHRNRPPEDGGKPMFNSGDAWQLMEAMREHWQWVVLGGILFAGLGLAGGIRMFPPSYRATAQLIRNESPRTAEVFTYQTLTPQSFANLLRSPELLNSVALHSDQPIGVDRLTKRLKVLPLRDGDVIQVDAVGTTKEAAMELANLYTTEAVQFTKQLQSRAAGEVLQFVTPQINATKNELNDLKNKERPLPKAMPVARPLRPSPMDLKLQTAREELVDALTRYTDTHPAVQAARAKVESLAKQSTNSPPAAVLPTEAEMVGQFALQRDAWEALRSELQPLEGTLRDLMKRQNAAKLVSAEPPGYYRVLTPASPRDVKSTNWQAKLAITSGMGGVVGMVLTALIALCVELMGTRLKAPADVRRVTGLPLIATAPDLDEHSEVEQRNWAFRTWTALQGRFSLSSNHGLVCGITSAGRGEGRSTWVKMLARAASESGFRVLKVTAGDYGRNLEHPNSYPMNTNGHNGNGHSETNGHEAVNGQNGHVVPAVMTSLPTPSEVENKLIEPQSQRVVQIPLPGWAWNLERRKQWQSALREWSKLDNVVILIELPPASEPEAILLAEELPNLIWLTDSGTSKAEETRDQIETLRSARCNLVGAVLNRAAPDKLRKRLARWVPAACVLLLPMLALAQDQPPITNALVPPEPIKAESTVVPARVITPAVVESTNVASAGTKAGRAPWQQKFTLGPGDVIKISLYNSPELTRNEVVIAPDGRVGFLEAQDIVATGLTVDELRLQIDKELGNFRRAPRTMISPVTLKSKKYAVLGKVVQRGVYSIDHPTTVLEAIALAKGFELGIRERDSIDLVDLQKSFLMRGGKRVSLNFEKMFLDGDLSQNIYIEPGDFLFFPPGGVKEVHVVGDVRYPGSVTWTPDLSVVTAISQRAGLNEKAYQSRVLVIRGSLENPQKFIVDTKAVLKGKQGDFRLEPQDIIYVTKRPWWRAEDLLDLAITAFLQSVVTSVVGQDVMKPFNP